MEWAHIRAHYERAFRASGLTQTAVAEAGGVGRQNKVSKLLNNEKQGPVVETFVRAVIGLGISPSEFFRTLEETLERGDVDVVNDHGFAGSFARTTRIHPAKPSSVHGEATIQNAARMAKAMAAFFAALGDPPVSRRRPARTAVRKKRPRPRR